MTILRCNSCYDLDLKRLAARNARDPEVFRSFLALTKPDNEFDVDLVALEFTAEQGCTICSILIRGVRRLEPEWKRNLLGVKDDPSLCSLELKITEKSVICRMPETQYNFTYEMEFFTALGSNSPYPAFGIGSPSDSSQHATQCYDIIRKSILECDLSHPSCRASATERRSPPKRLLDLNPLKFDSSTELMNIELWDPVSDRVPYAALSHCWGIDPIPKLTTMICQSRHGDDPISFELSSLSKSFQDAVTATKHLGLRYLWIDALCIIQDDPLDWEEEAAKMGSIYANSYITISATSAKDSASGFLSKVKPCEIQTDIPDGSQFSVFVRKHLSDEDHAWILRPYFFQKVPPLLGRGWCFQERMLATRVLHYTGDEMVLECAQGYRCECDNMKEIKLESLKVVQSWLFSPKPLNMELVPRELIEEVTRHSDSDESLRFQEQMKVALASTDSNLRYSLGWDFFAQQYSATSLTYQEDVLPALSALAQHVKNATLKSYLAGIWKEDIPRSLLWISDGDTRGDSTIRHAKRSKPTLEKMPKSSYIAPSFSWTSRVGKIRWLRVGIHSTPLVQLIRAECKPLGQNQLGEVNDGFLLLRGHIVKVSNQGFDATQADQVDGQKSIYDDLLTSAAWDTQSDLKNTVKYKRNLYIVPLYSVPDFDGDNYTIFLVLHLADERAGAYQRVGIFTYFEDLILGQGTEDIAII